MQIASFSCACSFRKPYSKVGDLLTLNCTFFYTKKRRIGTSVQFQSKYKQDIQKDRFVKGGQQADGCLLHELHARSCFTHFNASNESAGGHIGTSLST